MHISAKRKLYKERKKRKIKQEYDANEIKNNVFIMARKMHSFNLI